MFIGIWCHESDIDKYMVSILVVQWIYLFCMYLSTEWKTQMLDKTNIRINNNLLKCSKQNMTETQISNTKLIPVNINETIRET